MEIFLLRHGIAEEMSATGRDEDRKLTDKGIEKLRGCARKLKCLEVRMDAVLASPYMRAQETARVVLEEWGEPHPIRTSDALVPHAEGSRILKELSGMKAESVMLVGHEPHLSRLISLLISGGSDLSITMKKGGLCKVCTPDGGGPHAGSGTLDWLLAPKHLLANG